MTPSADHHVNRALNTATAADILAHLEQCDASFTPPLSTRVNLEAYAAKLYAKAMLFESWEHTLLIGLVAAYPDLERGCLFITNMSVLPDWHGQGIATDLITRSAEAARDLEIKSLVLEVSAENRTARRLYVRLGFTESAAVLADDHTLKLKLDL